jgi:hypothetical protein
MDSRETCAANRRNKLLLASEGCLSGPAGSISDNPVLVQFAVDSKGVDSASVLDPGFPASAMSQNSLSDEAMMAIAGL